MGLGQPRISVSALASALALLLHWPLLYPLLDDTLARKSQAMIFPQWRIGSLQTKPGVGSPQWRSIQGQTPYPGVAISPRNHSKAA